MVAFTEWTFGSLLLISLNLCVGLMTCDFSFVKVSYATPTKKVILKYRLSHVDILILLFIRFWYLRSIMSQATGFIPKPFCRLALKLWWIAPLQQRLSLTLNQALYFLSITWDKKHLGTLVLVILLLILWQLLTCFCKPVFYPVLKGHQANMTLWVTIKHHFTGFKSS